MHELRAAVYVGPIRMLGYRLLASFAIAVIAVVIITRKSYAVNLELQL